MHTKEILRIIREFQDKNNLNDEEVLNLLNEFLNKDNASKY